MTAQDQEAHEIKETSPLNLTGLLPDKFTLETQGVKTDQFKKQRLTRRASKKKKIGRQRNNPQMKGKQETSETMLKEIEASQLSYMDFKQCYQEAK